MTTIAGQKLAAYRAQQQPPLTQADLGRRYGISASAVCRWECGERRADAATIAALERDGICALSDWFESADGALPEAVNV